MAPTARINACPDTNRVCTSYPRYESQLAVCADKKCDWAGSDASLSINRRVRASDYGLIAIRSGLQVCGMLEQRLPLFVLLLLVKVICWRSPPETVLTTWTEVSAAPT